MTGETKIGPALKRLRKAAGLRQKDLAAELRVSKSVPSRLESQSSNPRLTTLVSYLNAIGADFSDLQRELDGGGDPEAATVGPRQRPTLEERVERIEEALLGGGVE